MDVFEAAYRLAHDFEPDGAVGLARKLGVNPGTLLNQLNPNTDTHTLALGRAVQMSVFTEDPRILDAFAGEMGRVTFPLPKAGAVSDMAMLDLVLLRDERVGEFAGLLNKAWEDGRITQGEIKQLRTQGMKVVSAFLELLARLEDISK